MKKTYGYLCFILLISAGNLASASKLTYWTANIYPAQGGVVPTRHSDPAAACMSLIGSPPENWWWTPKVIKKNSSRYRCYRAYSAVFCPSCGDQYMGYAQLITITCQYGHKDFECNSAIPACEYGSFYTQSNQCVAGSDKGRPQQVCSIPPSGSYPNDAGQMVGNPVNILTGNKFHQETYFIASGAGGLNFKNTYNSADATWRHSYSDKLVFSSDHILVSLSDGKDLRYSLSGAPVDGAASRFGILNAKSDGWTFTTKNQLVYFFDKQGRLSRLKLRNNQAHQLSYESSEAGIKVLISDDFGEVLEIKKSLTGQLLGFDAPGINIRVYYAIGNVVKIVKEVNGQQLVRNYHYEDPRNILLLTGITDERGVRYATWKYDAQGRAISSEHIDGVDKVLINYENNLSTTVTNELGKKAIYQLAIIDGNKRIISINGQPSANCPNSNSTFTYDERGLLKTKIDNKGHLTTYAYNDRGLEVSRTEAAGTPQARTVTTDWHPTLFLPVTVTEPSRITHYTYDDQGRQLSQSVTQR